MKHWLPIILSFTTFAIFWSCDQEKENEVVHDPPVVTILSPAQDATVEDTTVIEVDGLDWSGAALDRIVYLIDGVARYTDPNPGADSPASVWAWPTAEFSDGFHEISVVGYDSDGRSDDDRRTYAISNTVPVELATGMVRSSGSGTIQTAAGARIRVPFGAVPRDSAGREATIVFSIEKAEDFPFGPPHGQQAASNVYKFGPSGFVFARPVEITVPVMEDVDPADHILNLYRYNPVTGVWEDFAGDYDLMLDGVMAQTFELSNWAVGINQQSGESANTHGCVYVDNSSGGWLYLCVENYTLTNPGWDQPYAPERKWMAMFAPSGYNWPSEGHWWLPQGTYTVCVQVQSDFDEHDISSQLRELVVDQNGGRLWDMPAAASDEIDDFEATPPGNEITNSPCGCIPEPTIPVGTGEVQVTLQWWNPAEIDLDLWVVDPDGERCYFANPVTASGGELDRDNLCGNYINGQPENIFWENAVTGEYQVFVHWWSDCGNGMSAQDFEVRLISPQVNNTFNLTISRDDTVAVTEFLVGSTAITNPDPDRWLREAPTYPADMTKDAIIESNARAERASK